MRIFWLTLSVLSGAIFGLDRIGVTPIAPGPDVNFTAKVTHFKDSSSLLTLKTDAGTFDCRLHLELQGDVQAGALPRVTLHADKQLSTNIRQIQNHIWELEIFDRPTRENPTPPFKWTAGDMVEVYFPHARLSEDPIRDWVVYLQNNESDRLSKAKWRHQWFFISLGLLILSIISGFQAAIKKDDIDKVFTPQTCVAEIIRGLQATDPAQSKKIKALLLAITLEGSSVPDALEAIEADKNARIPLWFKSRGLFITRLDFFLNALTDCRKRLENGKTA